MNEVYQDLEAIISEHGPTISPIEEIKSIVRLYPNNEELGKAIRNYINKYHEGS